MKHKKKNSVTLGDPGDGAPAPDRRSPIEKQAERQEQQIVDLIAETKLAEGYISLKRRAVGETEFGHLAEIAASVFSEENIKKIYGGGDYKAQFFSASRKFAGGHNFKIDYAIPAKCPGAEKPEDRTADRTPEIISAVTAAMKQNTPAGPDPLTMELIRQQGQMMIAMVSRPATPAADPALATALAELAREVRELKAARGGGDSFQKTLENARSLYELAGGGGGGDLTPEKPDRVTEAIRAFGPAAAALVHKFVNGTGQPPDTSGTVITSGARPMLTAGADPAAAQPNPTQDPNVNPLLEIFLPEFRRLALLAAEKGRAPLDWVDTKLDEIDAKYHPTIFQLANSEDWFAKLFRGDPSANTRIAWMLEMRNAILIRMLVANTHNAARAIPRPDPKVYAGKFLDEVSVSFHDPLWNLLDAETWQSLLVAPYNFDEPTRAWFEEVRAAFEKELDDDGAEEVAATSAESGAVVSKPEAATAGATVADPSVISDATAAKRAAASPRPASRVPAGTRIKKPIPHKPKSR